MNSCLVSSLTEDYVPTTCTSRQWLPSISHVKPGRDKLHKLEASDKFLEDRFAGRRCKFCSSNIPEHGSLVILSHELEVTQCRNHCTQKKHSENNGINSGMRISVNFGMNKRYCYYTSKNNYLTMLILKIWICKVFCEIGRQLYLVQAPRTDSLCCL